jgi:predicted Rossmann fold flavoprotein
MAENTFDVIVIGGGAAGMMAAYIAAQHGKKVAILEKNASLGKKLQITGGGRCNITNAEYDTRSLLEQYGAAKKFLFSPFAQFGVKETFAFFASHGLPLVVQANNRAFPKTEKAHDVCNTFTKLLAQRTIRTFTHCSVKKFIRAGQSITGIETNKGIYTAKSYILATGGVSHPETGSTGDGFHWLRSIGHTVKAPTPTIVPLAVNTTWIKQLAGVTLKDCKITFYLDGIKQFSKRGNILCTHFGLSGPLILNSAGAVADLLQSGEVTAQIDAFPNKDLGTLEKDILLIFDNNKNKLLKNIFRDITPSGTASSLQQLWKKIDFTKPVNSITKDERKRIVNGLKSLPVMITGLMGTDRAVAADGGVILEEVDMRTMRSKLYANLYVVGDILHINRPSGGYSLQLCWTTGYVAGNTVS